MMDINEAIGELNDFFDDGPCNVHFEAWDVIRKALTEIAALADTIEECFQADNNYLGLSQVKKLRQLSAI